MKIIWSASRNEQSHSNHSRSRDSFEQHNERMNTFRKAHDFTQRTKSMTTPHDNTIKPDVRWVKCSKNLSVLLHLGSLLRLIHTNGTVMLPKNWQN